jgi:glycosyltransferase involved in cell wall biosynthesis
VPAQDAHALATAIERLLADPALSERLGAAARAHCAARFSYATMLDRMEAVYQGLLEARAQAAG